MNETYVEKYGNKVLDNLKSMTLIDFYKLAIAVEEDIPKLNFGYKIGNKELEDEC